MNTNSKKLNELLATAEKLGLTVNVEVKEDGFFETITASITRGIDGASNALELLYSSETILVTASRFVYGESRKAFKLTAHLTAVFSDVEKLTLKSLPIRVKMMADDLARYNERKVA
jgi:hypothetical protein